MNRFLLIVERYGPALIGLMIFCFLILYRTEIQRLTESKDISLTDLYSAVFGWASIQTGFLFSVYGFIAAKNDGFVAQISGSKAMKLFQSYTMRAMFIGFVLTVCTIPLMVTGSQGLTTFRFVLISGWFSMFAWAFAAFLRVAVGFGQIVSVKDRTTYPG